MTEPTSLDRAIETYRIAKQLAERAQADVEEARDMLVYELEKAGAKSHTYEGHRATVVKTSSYAFNESGLKKALGARVFNKMTTAKLDKKKLEAAMEAGDVDPRIVATYATEREGAAHIRLTESKQ